jgi:hypothetical protein
MIKYFLNKINCLHRNLILKEVYDALKKQKLNSPKIDEHIRYNAGINASMATVMGIKCQK